jgi:hypothetical protein
VALAFYHYDELKEYVVLHLAVPALPFAFTDLWRACVRGTLPSHEAGADVSLRYPRQST